MERRVYEVLLVVSDKFLSSLSGRVGVSREVKEGKDGVTMN